MHRAGVVWELVPMLELKLSARCGNFQPLFPYSPLHLCAQVYRAKMEGDTGALTPRMKSGTPSSSQLNISVLGRSPSPKVWPWWELCPMQGCCCPTPAPS